MTIRKATGASLLATLLIVMTIACLGSGVGPSFGDPLAGLNAAQLAQFNAGLAAFNFSVSVTKGLGPVFNAPVSDGIVPGISCATCHTDPASGGGSSTQLETRFGCVTADGVFDPLVNLGGSLMQNQGIGQVGTPPNGFFFAGEVVPPQANVVAGRRTTPLFGAGLVEAVSDEVLMLIAAQQRFLSPHTAGRPSLVVDPPSTQTSVGRFGWKAQHSSLFAFAGDAYLNEMGVTTPDFPDRELPARQLRTPGGFPRVAAWRRPNRTPTIRIPSNLPTSWPSWLRRRSSRFPGPAAVVT